MKLFLQNRLSGENAINQSNRANILITKTFTHQRKIKSS
jgi:hypothetical protein